MCKTLLKKLLTIILAFVFIFSLTCQISSAKQANTGIVSLVKNPDGSFDLNRDGKCYFIKGAATMLNGNGADPEFSQLVAAGGNSVRTWGAADDPLMFEAAYQKGLTVCAGLWLNRPYEMDYNDPIQVQQQHDSLINYVNTNKDHPAILLWGVGNEYEGDGSNPNVWKAADQIAATIKEIDPKHPTMTVIAGFSPEKVKSIKAYCPHIDIIGFNSYGGLSVLPDYFEQLDLDRPYIITEYGAKGQWESPTVKLGSTDVPLEMTSSEKASYILDNYNTSIVNRSNRTVTKFCLGSYAYFWGIEPRFANTHTWFETHLYSTYERLNSVDILTKAWKGAYPHDKCPEIEPLISDANGKEVSPGGKYLASVVIKDKKNSNLSISWEVRPEIAGVGQPLDSIAGSIVRQYGRHVIFKVPELEGIYRLFVYVKDNKGNAATANFPFYSKPGLTILMAPDIPID